MKVLMMVALRVVAVWSFAMALAQFASGAGSLVAHGGVSIVLQGFALAVGLGALAPIFVWLLAPRIAGMVCEKNESATVSLTLSMGELLFVFLVSIGVFFLVNSLLYIAQAIGFATSGTVSTVVDSASRLFYDQAVHSNIAAILVRLGVGLVLIFKANRIADAILSRNR